MCSYSGVLGAVWPNPPDMNEITITPLILGQAPKPMIYSPSEESKSITTALFNLPLGYARWVYFEHTWRERRSPPPPHTLKSLGWYGGPIKTGTGARSKSTALEHKIWEASKEPRQKGSLAILEPSASVAEVKGDHQSSWQGESHFSAEMWWLDSREDGRVADGGCRDVGLPSQCIPLLCVSQQQHPLELLVNNDDLTRRRGLTNTDNSYFPFARAVMGSYFSLSGFCSSANCEQVCSERAAPHAAFCPNSEIIHRTVRGRETKTHSRDLLGQKKSDVCFF